MTALIGVILWLVGFGKNQGESRKIKTHSFWDWTKLNQMNLSEPKGINDNKKLSKFSYKPWNLMHPIESTEDISYQVNNRD